MDPAYYTVAGFISALFTVLLKYVIQEALGVNVDTTEAVSATTPTGNNGDNALAAPDKATQEKEKELLERYRPVLQAFLHDHLQLQVTALYALQAFCHGLTFPKGLLLRWFVLLYDLEIVEEEAFLKWKEDLSDDTPGKGKALFQVFISLFVRIVGLRLQIGCCLSTAICFIDQHSNVIEFFPISIKVNNWLMWLEQAESDEDGDA